MTKRRQSGKKRVVKVGLRGLHRVIQEIEKAGQGRALIDRLGNDHNIVGISASTYTQLKDIIMTEPALESLRDQFGCDPINDPECIPWR
jgi:hypothetical protein